MKYSSPQGPSSIQFTHLCHLNCFSKTTWWIGLAHNLPGIKTIYTSDTTQQIQRRWIPSPVSAPILIWSCLSMKELLGDVTVSSAAPCQLVSPTAGSRLPAWSPQTQIRQPSLQTSISRHWEAVSPMDKSQCLERGKRPERPRCMTLPVDSHTIQYAIVPVN